jgi:organic radical activating enzyme
MSAGRVDAPADVKGTVAKQTELAPVHDFAAKLCQPSIAPRLKEYVQWQIEWRRARAAGDSFDRAPAIPDSAPVSINLDLTTACNYACDHCVDFEILNTGTRYDHDTLMRSLHELTKRGLRSVIVIGGGEPTVYPKFAESIREMKSLGLQIGIVTNGSYMDRILAVADCLAPRDWVRLSLDSGTDPTFQAMHKPKRPIALEEICAGVPPVKRRNGSFAVGFSYIIVWDDCEANDAAIHPNVDEIVVAAELARRFEFDYISYKPFLTRARRNNAEIVGLTNQESRVDPIMAAIRREVDRAKTLETDRFKVIESTNLRVLENGSYQNYTQQPRNCHMQYFRQVLSPLGLYNCPVYRHVPQALIGDKQAYADPETVARTQRNTLRIVDSFNAKEECREVTCLYNHVNWFIERLIQEPGALDRLEPSAERGDFFL